MRISKIFIVVAFVIAVFAGTQTTLAAEKKPQLTFAIIQTEDMSVLAERWEPMLKYLGEKAGIQISFYATTSYSAVI